MAGISLQVTDLCPCRSGRRISECCGQTGALFRTRATTKPPGPSTGYSHPSCYAQALNDCGRTISAEHFISADVLNQLGKLDPVRGFTWLGPDGSASIPAKALASNVLCKR